MAVIMEISITNCFRDNLLLVLGIVAIIKGGGVMVVPLVNSETEFQDYNPNDIIGWVIKLIFIFIFIFINK